MITYHKEVDHISEIIVTTINKEVYEQLKEEILLGSIKPGEKITIRDIASKLGVSTMPVREAIRRLQAEGFLEFEKRCVKVRKLSSNDLQQLFVIRQRLETLAIEWALPHMTVMNLQNLKEILAELDQDTITHHEWLQLNRKFHLSIYQLSRSTSLQKLIENTWDTVTPYMYIYTSSVSSYEYSQKQHYQMLKLMEEQNKEELIHLLIDHLDDTCKTIMFNLINSEK